RNNLGLSTEERGFCRACGARVRQEPHPAQKRKGFRKVDENRIPWLLRRSCPKSNVEDALTPRMQT
ncbi:MAG: hypothetical protein ACOVLE_01470, partial [Pirellula staleyi]